MKRFAFRTAWLWAAALIGIATLAMPAQANVTIDKDGDDITITGTSGVDDISLTFVKLSAFGKTTRQLVLGDGESNRTKSVGKNTTVTMDMGDGDDDASVTVSGGFDLTGSVTLLRRR